MFGTDCNKIREKIHSFLKTKKYPKNRLLFFIVLKFLLNLITMREFVEFISKKYFIRTDEVLKHSLNDR